MSVADWKKEEWLRMSGEKEEKPKERERGIGDEKEAARDS